jgi:uncharacterized membrane protein YbhN (UPF0104 family)
VTASPRRRIAVAAVGSLFVVVAVAGAVYALLRDLSAVRGSLRSISVPYALAAVALAVVSVAMLAERWRATLITLGTHASRSDVRRWFMAGQIGKYVPGGVWHVVGQGELARRAGVDRRVAYSSVLLSTAALLGGATLMVIGGRVIGAGVAVPWWVIAVGLLAVVMALVPPVRNRLVARLDDSSAGARLTPGRLAALTAGSIPVWLVIGASTWCVAAALDARVDARTLVVGAVASWLVGIATIPAPGGIGAREAVLVALLDGALGTATATLVALVSRLVFVVADVGCFVVARRGVSVAARRAASSTASG